MRMSGVFNGVRIYIRINTTFTVDNVFDADTEK